MAKKKKNIIKRILTNPIFTNLIIMAGVFIVLVFITLFALNIYTKHNESITIPTVKGLQIEEAAGILRSKELSYEVVDSNYRANVAPGAILEQTPKENSNVKKGRVVFLVVQAKTRQLVSIPLLKDYSRRQAEAQLNALGFTNIAVVEVPAQFKGLVISLEYNGATITPGQKVPKGSTIRMLVGGGGRAEVYEDIEDDSLTPDIDESFF